MLVVTPTGLQQARPIKRLDWQPVPLFASSAQCVPNVLANLSGAPPGVKKALDPAGTGSIAGLNAGANWQVGDTDARAVTQ